MVFNLEKVTTCSMLLEVESNRVTIDDMFLAKSSARSCSPTKSPRMHSTTASNAPFFMRFSVGTVKMAIISSKMITPPSLNILNKQLLPNSLLYESFS